MKKRKRVEIEWEDTMGAGGWFDPEDLQKFVVDPHSTCYTVGYLVHKDRKVLVIAQSINAANRGAPFSIPRRMVRRIRPL